MYNRLQVKMQAKQSLSGKWGIALGTIIVAGLITAVAAYVPLASLVLVVLFR